MRRVLPLLLVALLALSACREEKVIATLHDDVMDAASVGNDVLVELDTRKRADGDAKTDPDTHIDEEDTGLDTNFEDDTCEQGQCACRRKLSLCGEECVDLQTDGAHCGVCNNVCEEGCYLGECASVRCEDLDPPAAECGPEGTTCVVIDTFDTNPLHCGGCDNACSIDEVCVGDIDESGEGSASCAGFQEAAECTTCPCDTCGEDVCCIAPGTDDVVLCVESDEGGEGFCPKD